MIRDFSHVTISCSDLERSVAFYQRIGLEIVRRVGELESEGVARAFGLTGGHLSVVHLAPPGAAGPLVIDLVQWIDPPPTGEPYAALNSLGINRLAFRVQDVDATTAQLIAAGVEFLTSEPQAFGRGVRSITLRDPDGTFLQLIEGLDHMQREAN